MTTYPMADPHPLVKPLLGLTGSLPASVEVADGEVHVRLGAAFRMSFPRASVGRAEIRPTPARLSWTGWGWGIGAHGFGGRWLVNTAMRGLVEIDLTVPAHGRLLGLVPVRVTSLCVSMAVPDELVEELSA